MCFPTQAPALDLTAPPSRPLSPHHRRHRRRYQVSGSRPPHCMIADVCLSGVGQVPLPGEVSLAHHGVRWLDARREFKRDVLQVLHQPLERVSHEYKLPRVRDLAALATIAGQVAPSAGSRAPLESPRTRVSGTVDSGRHISIDKPAHRPYTCVSYDASVHPSSTRHWSAGRALDALRRDRLLPQASRHAWWLIPHPLSPEAPTPDPRLSPPCEEGDPSGNLGVARLRHDRNRLVEEDRA
jgi:hypothetical protein